MAQKNDIAPELPLRRLFEALRSEARLPLGIAEYLDLLRAMQSGRGLADLESLRRLCVLLWAKSKEQIWQVNHHFDRIVVSDVQAVDPGELEPPTRENTVDQESASDRHTGNPHNQGERPSPQVDDPKVSAQRTHAAARAAAQQQAQAQTPMQQTKRYRLRPQYPQLGERQPAQAWRKLRIHARTGPKTETDLEATILHVAQTGQFLEPRLRKTLENAAELHFLMDRDGSMVPFHGFCRILMHGAKTTGNFPRLQVRYFHDFPGEHLYSHERLAQPQGLQAWLRGLDPRRSLVVVLSDAGAARGNADPARIRGTQAFLAALGSRCQRVVWLNPMPRHRWEGSSAATIAQAVPMFAATAADLHLAVDHLRGRISAATLLGTHSSPATDAPA